jgi:hypothetical protein
MNEDVVVVEIKKKKVMVDVGVVIKKSLSKI